MICAKCNATVTSWRVVDGATWCMRCSQDVPTHEEQIAALKAARDAKAESADNYRAEMLRLAAEVDRLTAEKAADFATLSAANKEAEDCVTRMADLIDVRDAEIARLTADVAALETVVRRATAMHSPDECVECRRPNGEAHTHDCANGKRLARTEPK